jgi:SAM-dependent methyltransferase
LVISLNGPFEIVKGFYSGCIVYYLHQQDLLQEFRTINNIFVVAKKFGLDPDVLYALIEFTSQTTDIIIKVNNENFVLNSSYQSYLEFGFHLDKFIGAYGDLFNKLEIILQSPTIAGSFVDKHALAQAFHAVSFEESFIVNLFQEWGVDSLLDLGCGSGSLLFELCKQNSNFCGWGIDKNQESILLAMDRLSDSLFQKRLMITKGDVRNIDTLITSSSRIEIKYLFGRSIMNEFFANGTEEAIKFLKYLKNLFPDRLFIIIDYYGQLLKREENSLDITHTILQDIAQVVSGQGVPPSNLGEWLEIYLSAECKVVHVYEQQNLSMKTFIHVVKL